MFKHVISLLLFAVLSVHGVSAQDAEQINEVVRFAVIGDYGSGSDGAYRVRQRQRVDRPFDARGVDWLELRRLGRASRDAACY